MLFTHITIDNLYGFKNTEVDFTLKRKPTASTIDNESLSFAPNFKIKKVCVLSGANASGKTAFGRVLCGMQNFITRYNLVPYLKNAVCDKNFPANVTIEFVTTPSHYYPHAKLHLLSLTFNEEIQSLSYFATQIRKNETNTKTRKRLQKIKETNKAGNNEQCLSIDFINEETEALSKFRKFKALLEVYDKGGWSYTFADSENKVTEVKKENFTLDNKQLNSFIKAFDCSINRVETLRADSQRVEGLKIIWNNADEAKVLFGENGEISSSNRLSRGTLEAVMITALISRIKDDIDSNVYYIDEQMAYCHSEMEQAVLNVLIDLLSKDCQLFYTTHNYDIIEMNLPLHSHYIFKRQESISTIINLGEAFKKNDRSALNYLKNDVFSTLPNTDGIDFLLYE